MMYNTTMTRLLSAALIFAWGVAACSDSTGNNNNNNGGGPTIVPILFNDDTGSSLGRLDPSLAYPGGASGGLMAYSSVPSQQSVHTRVAASYDGGATWTFLADVNFSTADTITTTDTTVCGATTCIGTWVHEVPSVVVDTGDFDANRRYKVFVHSHFVTGTGKVVPQYGNLSMYSAPAGAGPWSAEDRILGWNSASPVSSTGVGQNISTDTALTGVSNCLLLTEPGAQVRGSTIDLAVGCLWYSGTKFPIDIRLLRSTDHGTTWKFVSVLVDTAGANFLGSDRAQINGADLFTVGTNYYLLADPQGGTYLGCVELQFSSIDAGTLTQITGGPEARRQFHAPAGVGWTPCTAAAGARQAGILMGISNPSAAPPFKIVGTLVGPP